MIFVAHALALAAELLVWPFAGNPMVGWVNSALALLGGKVAFLY